MSTRLRRMWVGLRSSFWFVPALMILAAAILAVALIEVDSALGLELAEHFPRLFGANAEGARNILTTVASSMMSIAGVTFSITIVALSLASGQYSSRILRNFMRDRANQCVLGVFLSIHLYCLIVLRSIRGGSDEFVPSISIVSGILLGVVGIAFLIFFIHHVALSIQASHIIANVSGETLAVVRNLYPEKHGTEDESDAERESCTLERTWVPVPALTTGFVQTVDQPGLIAWAEKNDQVLRMTRGIGEFIVAGNVLLAIAGRNEPDAKTVKRLNSFYSIDAFRTIEQDAAFGVRQLVDISLKALSPGVNDTTTAVTCLNYLGSILEEIGRRRIPAEVCLKDGKVRLIARTQTYQYFVDEAFHQIRQEAKGNVAVHLALLDTIGSAAHARLSEPRRKILRQIMDRAFDVATSDVRDENDRRVIKERRDKVSALLRVRAGAPQPVP